MSPRERLILSLIVEGKANKQIAHETGLSETTIKNYLTNLFNKLGVDNRTSAAVWWLQNSQPPRFCSQCGRPLDVAS